MSLSESSQNGAKGRSGLSVGYESARAIERKKRIPHRVGLGTEE